jgi:hypothetical protein
MNFQIKTDYVGPNKSSALSLLLSINYEIYPKQGVCNYETKPTGINSIGDLELQIQNKQVD